MKKRLNNIILILATVFIIVAVPNSAKAATTSAVLCDQLFAGDQTNIFKEVLCSLTRVTSRTIADLATNTVCTIQSVGNASNYSDSIVFGSAFSGSNQCTVRGGWSSTGTPAELPVKRVVTDRDPFGTKPNATGGGATGLYLPNTSSQLSKNLSSGTSGSNIKNAFNVSRAMTAALAFIALLIFAFANILHIEINTYAVKKALPSILIALVGGALSLTIIFVFSRGVDQLYRLNMFDPAHTINQMNSMFEKVAPSLSTKNFSTASDAVDSSVQLVFDVGGNLLGKTAAGGSGSTNASFVSGVFGSILLIIPAILIIIFQYVLALRPFAVSLLTIAAPLAFACLVLPQTQIIFRKWWTYLLIALFYAPIVNFTFYVSNLITDIPPASSGANPVVFIAAWVFRVAVFIFLIRLPFTVELDIRKITARLAKTSFGEALGFGRFAGAFPSGQAKETKTPSDKVNISASKTLSSDETKNLIASTEPAKRVFTRQIEGNRELDNLRNQPFVSGVGMANLRAVSREANTTNMSRTPSLMVKSVEDIKPDIFKAVVNQSDLKLWRDTRLIEQLKNQNGQVLNNDGIALRADSIRKIVRLSQVTQNGRLSNPEAVKLIAQKGALNSLPTTALKEAVKEGILTKEDFRLTYRNNTEKTFQKILSSERSHKLDIQSARLLMQQDHQDYQSGYKDLANLFSNISKDQRLVPPPAPSIVKNIVKEMKSVDDNTFEHNGSYFFNRLQNQLQASQAQIASSLTKAGTPNKTAGAIALNPRLDFAEAKNYYANDKMTGVNLQQLKEGFMERDLSSNLIREISDIVTREKSMVGKSITQKIAGSLKNDETVELSGIKNSMETLVSRMAKPMSPQDVQAATREVNKYHPAAILMSPTTTETTDLDKLRNNAEDVASTVEQLIEAGVQRENLLNNPVGAQNTIEQKVRQKVRQDVMGEDAAAKKKPAQDKTVPPQKDDNLNQNVINTAIKDVAEGKPNVAQDPLAENIKGQEIENKIKSISLNNEQTTTSESA